MLDAVHGQPPTLRKRLAGRALGSDRPDDLGALVALFGLFAIADRWSQLIASGPSRSDIGGATLILTAIERRHARRRFCPGGRIRA
jgi:hypothetical protein